MLRKRIVQSNFSTLSDRKTRMDDTPQQQENRTNSLSEHHVQSAIETVLANRVQTYEEFMESFMVLTPDDVAEFAARRRQTSGDEIGELPGENTNRISEAHATPSNPSSDAQNKLCSHGSQKEEEEELEIEELGEDIASSEERQTTSTTTRSAKYIQVDNYLDEPDSESEFLSGSDDDDALEFDDSSSKYVASFDTEQEVEGAAAKSAGPVRVTPEMISRVTDESDFDTSMEEVVTSPPPFSGPYPGEVDDEDSAAPHPRVSPSSQHITQLPHTTRLPQPSDIPAMAQTSQADTEVTHDAVEAFSIDPDFDYDSVTLTPKWQPGEGPPFGT